MHPVERFYTVMPGDKRMAAQEFERIAFENGNVQLVGHSLGRLRASDPESS
jgi:hypothetical protein